MNLIEFDELDGNNETRRPDRYCNATYDDQADERMFRYMRHYRPSS